MVTVKVSSKGQIAIPKPIRQELGLKEGTELSIDVQGQTLVMKRVVRSYPDWRTMQGAFRGADLLKARAEERQAELASEDAQNR